MLKLKQQLPWPVKGHMGDEQLWLRDEQFLSQKWKFRSSLVLNVCKRERINCKSKLLFSFRTPPRGRGRSIKFKFYSALIMCLFSFFWKATWPPSRFRLDHLLTLGVTRVANKIRVNSFDLLAWSVAELSAALRKENLTLHLPLVGIGTWKQVL